MTRRDALSYREIITTDTSLCVGCNKCVAKCIVKANIAFQHNGENKIKADPRKCIHCGA
ncbi:MAG: diguanylate cyclase protein [Firmicutes bacterium]|nr:diguanylate cyclase protein [Bacillota bacterium]